MLKSKIQKPNIINYDGHNNYKYFYHYDIETNDAAQSFYEKVFIQELQHAAIITDSDLNEIDRIDQMISGIVRRLESMGETDISYEKIGEIVMESLARIDTVAYVRFASVYKNFQAADDFEDFVHELRPPSTDE